MRASPAQGAAPCRRHDCLHILAACRAVWPAGGAVTVSTARPLDRPAGGVSSDGVRAMPRIICSINATLSGTCHHGDVVADAEHHRYAAALARSAAALLLGRATYELFAAFWPRALHRRDLPAEVLELARVLDAKPRIVVSGREPATAWPGTTRVAGLEALRATLAGIGGSVVLFGSPGLAASLAAAGMLDEVHILLQPLFATRGPRLPPLWAGQAFRTVSAERFGSGVVLLRCRPAG
ncbi:hypothetical protein FQY79_15255 [Luteimonas wenzhouensis]|uniref:Bacterial bifunctional deaminase-reductase C-terminal domain-containing protein n=2 Tax=Lysobacteraceae TaxID=32033 RepID=A0A5C5TT11_9GAMM|nr:hypothetical protein FQY79_15255 [Luteimonas wenzhouensis]